MGCCGSNNQTDESVLKLLSESIKTEKTRESILNSRLEGTGIFAVVDPEKPIAEDGFPQYKVSLVKALTFGESVRRGRHCFVFKWVPNSVKSYSELQEERAQMTCWQSCFRGSIDCTEGTACLCDLNRAQCF